MYEFMDHDSSSFRSRGLVLLTVVFRCLEQCANSAQSRLVERETNLRSCDGQSPTPELRHPQRTLDWVM